MAKKSTKVDISGLQTVTNYAKGRRLTRPAVYYQIKHGQIRHETIDGVPFVYRKQIP